jgi:hypothetical protein
MKQKIIIGMIAVMILMIFITGCTDEKNAVSSPEDEMELPPPPPRLLDLYRKSLFSSKGQDRLLLLNLHCSLMPSKHSRNICFLL